MRKTSRLARLAVSASLCVTSAGIIATGGADAVQRPAHQTQDLADMVQGQWRGGVTSDVRGPSRNGVTLTVRKVGTNLVEISSDYPRLPVVRIGLMRTAGAIVNVAGNDAFVIELDRDPSRLHLSYDGAALIVSR